MQAGSPSELTHHSVSSPEASRKPALHQIRVLVNSNIIACSGGDCAVRVRRFHINPFIGLQG